jgi:hypothetical protein
VRHCGIARSERIMNHVRLLCFQATRIWYPSPSLPVERGMYDPSFHASPETSVSANVHVKTHLVPPRLSVQDRSHVERDTGLQAP